MICMTDLQLQQRPQRHADRHGEGAADAADSAGAGMQPPPRPTHRPAVPPAGDAHRWPAGGDAAAVPTQVGSAAGTAPGHSAIGDRPTTGAPRSAAAPSHATRSTAEAAAPAATAASAEDAVELLRLLRSLLATAPFDRAAGALATELAGGFGCDRVFVGIAARGFVRVAGLSHGSGLGSGQPLAQSVAAAMEEALDQAGSVLHPQHPDERPRITLAHAALARHAEGVSLLTVPMFGDGRPVGALTFERPAGKRFDPAVVRRAEAVAAGVAPLLMLLAEHEQPALQRLRITLDRRLAGLDRGQRLGIAAGSLAATAALAALLAVPVAFQVSAPTRLEGQLQRAMVAPVDGFLKTAHVRAGDSVRAGQPLAELDDEELRLERRRAESELARHENTYAEAQAKEDRAQLVIADSRVAEARAQLALLDQQLARTRLVAPFDAQVIKGDLTQQLGAPVKRGDLLLTLTPSNEFRVMLDLDERDVALVKPGAHGAVTLSALPGSSFALVVDRIVPVAGAESGHNLFQAEARLVDPAAADAKSLRPGLQGVARIDAGERSLAWQMSHRMLDWLRLQWWSWAG